MKARSKILITLTIVIIIIVSITAIILLSQGEGEIEKASDFTLIDIDGNEFNLSNVSDKVIVLDFMFIDCSSCLESENNISQAYLEFEGEIHIISIDINPSDTPEELNDYRDQNGFNFTNWTFALDDTQQNGDLVNELYNVDTTSGESNIFFINTQGYISFHKEGVLGNNEFRAEVNKAFVIKKAPDFTLIDIDGNEIKLSNLTGKVVIIDFMYIECPSCKIAENNLKEVYPQFKDEIFIISIDVLATDTDQAIRNHRDSEGINFDNWTFTRDNVQSGGSYVYQLYGVHELVTIYVIDKEGYATYHLSGAPSSEDFKREIERALEGAQRIEIPQVSMVILAITAGVASFFSPCAFPMLPGYMAYFIGLQTSQKEELSAKKSYIRSFLGGMSSGIGIISIYVIIGIIFLSLGELANPYIPLLSPTIGIILIVLGALLFTNIEYSKLIRPFQKLASKFKRKKDLKDDKTKEVKVEKESKGFYLKLFRYGVGYGAAASACVVPIFFVLITTASSASITGTFLDGFLILLIYAFVVIGLMVAVTMILAIFGQKAAQKLSKYTEHIKKISAAILIIVGIYLIAYYIIAFA